MTGAADEARDLTSGGWFRLLVWVLPAVAILSSGLSGMPESGVTAVWTAGFLVMGLGCIRNALRCGRVHCWFTGPFFLLASAGSLLLGTGVLPFGEAGWNALGLTVVVGGIALYYVPEMIFGRHFGKTS